MSDFPPQSRPALRDGEKPRPPGVSGAPLDRCHWPGAVVVELLFAEQFELEGAVIESLAVAWERLPLDVCRTLYAWPLWDYEILVGSCPKDPGGLCDLEERAIFVFAPDRSRRSFEQTLEWIIVHEFGHLVNYASHPKWFTEGDRGVNHEGIANGLAFKWGFMPPASWGLIHAPVEMPA
jgi:hypothetical protein